MMKMSGRVTSCCVALLFVLTSVSAVQRDLDSINDLKEINFGQSVPTHSLLLLHWFANTVDMDNNNIIRLTFDPNSGDYSSHYYGNYEGLLDRLDRGSGYRYYTIGNLNQETSMPLPPYVVRLQWEYEETNRDRIIIRATEQNIGGEVSQRIDQVYITQHYHTYEDQGTPYDPDHTYGITANLLRQIREFSVEQRPSQLLHLSELRNRYASSANEYHIRNTWGDLACLGLLLFIVIQKKYSTNQRNNRQKRRTHWGDDDSESKRYVHRCFQNQGHVVVDINDDEDQEASRRTGNRESGLNNTSVPLNNNRRSFCCICCIASICVISFCAILLFIFFYKWNIK